MAKKASFLKVGGKTMKEKILIVDDEERMRKLIVAYLKRDGYETIEAENGEKAINICELTTTLEVVASWVISSNEDKFTKLTRQNQPLLYLVLHYSLYL